MLSCCSQGALLYNIPLLTLYPEYTCHFPDGRVQNNCQPEDFCPIGLEPEINWENPTSLHNWIENYDAQCIFFTLSL